MILKLWEGVSLKQYNNWFPLTGKITAIPLKYKSDNPTQNWYQDVNEWFTTFALRAQNDINAYLNFIFNKFSFETLKNKDIKQSLIDMVFIRIEHDCFNRVPIEFNTNATNTLTSGATFDANADIILGLRNLLPQRVQSLVKFTRLKPYFRTLSSKGINPNDIDLETFYTKFEVDALIEKEQIERIKGDQDNHDLTLAKQIKLYDDVITPQEESYRGPVTNLIVRGYVATDYDDKTETAIIDFPKEIGTLPPGALQPNPVEGDVTHAATADFSAKQQKRINANENNIINQEKRIESNENEIKKIKESIWIQGEYKYMDSKVTNMPSGWKKIYGGGAIYMLGTVNLESDPNITLKCTKGDSEVDTEYFLSFWAPTSGASAYINFVGEADNSKTISISNSSIWQYDPENSFSDLPNIIYHGEDSWRNFKDNRLKK